MGTVEVKEKSNVKRIKRSFPRHEVYHRWIHSPEYCYTNSNQRYAVSGYLNWLISGDFGKKYVDTATEESIAKDWFGWRKNSCIAVINREKKLIVVSRKYDKQSYELIRSIPDDYTIFMTEKEIPTADILSTGELSEALHLHSDYLITKFIENECSEFYKVILGNSRTCRYSIDTVFDKNPSKNNGYSAYANILAFVKKYKLKKESWYDVATKDTVYVRTYSGWNYNTYKIPLVSLKTIVTNKMFSIKEKILINQKAFYTKYCFGNGISFNEVKKHWFDKFNADEYSKLIKARNYDFSKDLKENPPALWRDGIILLSQAENASYKSYIESLYKQSSENYLAAEKEYQEKLKQFDGVNSWREGKNIIMQGVKYQKYHGPKTKFGTGEWTTETYTQLCGMLFPNIQLRIKPGTNDIIQTSKNATVSILDGIKMWQLYNKIIRDYKPQIGDDIIIRLEDRNIKLGIYNLRSIKWSQKKTDNGTLLDEWDWCVIIGCHYIWVKDFIDFMNYYNLNEIFNPSPTKSTNIKIKIQK